MGHCQLSKSLTLRVEEVLGFARDLGGINLLDAIHIKLVPVVVLGNKWRHSLFWLWVVFLKP